MKKLAIIVQGLGSLIRREKASLLVIMISLGLSIGVSLSMISYFSSSARIFRDMKIDKATYRLYFNEFSGALTPIEFFDRFFFSENSPVLRDAYYAVTFSTYPSAASSDVITYIPDNSQIEYGTQPPAAPKSIYWRSAFPDGRLAQLSEQPEEKVLLEGRWFETEEVKTGAGVAVVGRDDFPDVKVGDSITVLESVVSVIGIRKAHNTLPYVLMQKLSDNTKGFLPGTILCNFYKPLSKEQLDELASFCVTADCMFDIRKSGYFMEIAIMLAVSGGIFLLAVLNALGLFKHLISEARYRFMVLKVCGASRKTVFGGLYLTPLLICAISSLCGILLYRLLLEPWIIQHFQFEALPFWLLSAVFATVLLLCFLFLLPTVRRMTKAQPAETVLWR